MKSRVPVAVDSLQRPRTNNCNNAFTRLLQVPFFFFITLKPRVE